MKRERNEAGNGCLILIAICLLLGLLMWACDDTNNPCDDHTTIDPTTAQGNRTMRDCADGWQ